MYIYLYITRARTGQRKWLVPEPGFHAEARGSEMQQTQRAQLTRTSVGSEDSRTTQRERQINVHLIPRRVSEYDECHAAGGVRRMDIPMDN